MSPPRCTSDLNWLHPEDLRGLYTGIPLTERSVEHSATLPDVVTIYREGIFAARRTSTVY